MRFFVVGAGAVGGVVGGLLSHAGHDVTVLARGDHRQAIASLGLRVRTPDLDVVARPRVATSVADAAIAAGDVVLVAVKSQDTEAVVRELAVAADSRAVMVCLQNGLENERVVARRFATVLSIPVMLPASIVEPGVVAAWGTPQPAVLDVGRYPDQAFDAPLDPWAVLLADAFVSAGMLSTPRHDIGRWKRRKLLMNIGNAVQALLGLDGRPGGYASSGELLTRAIAEGEACFAAAGLDVATVEEDRVNREGRMQIGEIAGISRGGGSSWQSLVRGAGSIEADYLNGEVCLLGRLHGVATPVNDLLQRRANLAAVAGEVPGAVTEAELLAELDNG